MRVFFLPIHDCLWTRQERLQESRRRVYGGCYGTAAKLKEWRIDSFLRASKIYRKYVNDTDCSQYSHCSVCDYMAQLLYVFEHRVSFQNINDVTRKKVIEK